ncbi:MAG TPA: hypothetical protein VNS34_22135 [Rhizobiaceae bacterium]|nr:hypothetical protein [Rhizobiaceae bacterium]
MGILTVISQTQVSWTNPQTGEPRAGTYTWRGVTSTGSDIFQHDQEQSLICIKLFNSLIAVSDIKLENLQQKAKGGGGANYGLTQSPDTVFSFNTTSGDLSTLKYKGKKGDRMEEAAPSASTATTFNQPSFIVDKEGQQYYPMNYWYNPGNVHYFAKSPPVRLVDDSITNARQTYKKIQTVENLTATDVRAYGNQIRDPDQSVVMQRALGTKNPVSAREHLMTLLGISSEPREWHWCHLIAHSLRENGKGQAAENLVAGTAAVNGAMLALEIAIKEVLTDKGTPITSLDYDVEVDVIEGTHIAKYIRATVSQDANWSFRHYMEATVAERQLTAMTQEFKRAILAEYNKYARPESAKFNAMVI